MRKITSLIGLRVVAKDEGAHLGTISNVVVDLAAGEMLGVILGQGPAEKGIAAKDLKTMGEDAVLVKNSKVAQPLSEMPKLMERREALDRRPTEVITSSGQHLGVLGDIYINPDTKEVARFEVSGGSWKDLTLGILSVPIHKGIVHGPDVVIVPQKILKKLQPTGGLRKPLQKGYQEAAKRAEELYQEGSGALREGLSATRQRTKEAAKELKRSTRQKTAKTKESKTKSKTKKSK